MPWQEEALRLGYLAVGALATGLVTYFAQHRPGVKQDLQNKRRAVIPQLLGLSALHRWTVVLLVEARSAMLANIRFWALSAKKDKAFFETAMRSWAEQNNLRVNQMIDASRQLNETIGNSIAFFRSTPRLNELVTATFTAALTPVSEMPDLSTAKPAQIMELMNEWMTREIGAVVESIGAFDSNLGKLVAYLRDHIEKG